MSRRGKPQDNGAAGIRPFVPIIVLAILVAATVGAGTYILLASRGDDGGSDIEDPDENWMVHYSPEERRGSSNDDWWTYQPDQNPNSGIVPEHPSWIAQKIVQGPVLVLTHSEGCMPCITQQEDIGKLLNVYGDEVQFVDLLSGADQRASQMFDMYDPNGSPNYIPLTTLFTLIEDGNGDVRIAWHSSEGATGIEWLTKYTKDAIYYHDENAAEWGQSI